MKKNFKTIILSATVAAMALVSSCTKTCDPGYEGSDCKTAMNTKFSGTYAVKDTASSADTTLYFNYSMTVSSPSSEPAKVNISNFGGFGSGTTISGTVDGTSLKLDNTTLAGVQISNATGTISGSKLAFTYTSNEGKAFTSHAVGTK